jgi:hypothetical protein
MLSIDTAVKRHDAGPRKAGDLRTEALPENVAESGVSMYLSMHEQASSPELHVDAELRRELASSPSLRCIHALATKPEIG